MPDQLFTWNSLATLAGASFLTFLITAYLKRIVDRYWSWGTDLFAVIVGTLVILLSLLATGQLFTWELMVLSVFNGFLVAATAGKIHDKTLQERDRKFHTDAGM